MCVGGSLRLSSTSRLVAVCVCVELLCGYLLLYLSSLSIEDDEQVSVEERTWKLAKSICCCDLTSLSRG